MKHTALVSGITGPDRVHRPGLLRDKGPVAHGVQRRSSRVDAGRIAPRYRTPHGAGPRRVLRDGTRSDRTGLIGIVPPRTLRPTEVEPQLGGACQAKARLACTPKATLAQPLAQVAPAHPASVCRDGLVGLAGFTACGDHA